MGIATAILVFFVANIVLYLFIYCVIKVSFNHVVKSTHGHVIMIIQALYRYSGVNVFLVSASNSGGSHTYLHLSWLTKACCVYKLLWEKRLQQPVQQTA